MNRNKKNGKFYSRNFFVLTKKRNLFAREQSQEFKFKKKNRTIDKKNKNGQENNSIISFGGIDPIIEFKIFKLALWFTF